MIGCLPARQAGLVDCPQQTGLSTPSGIKEAQDKAR